MGAPDANETISSLQKENDTLKQRLQELESRHTSMKKEASILIDENKSLMTAIRLLNNELQTVLKADGVRCSRPNERPEKKEWLVVGAKKKKEKTKTKETKKDDPMIMTQVTTKILDYFRNSADHPIDW